MLPPPGNVETVVVPTQATTPGVILAPLQRGTDAGHHEKGVNPSPDTSR